MKSSEIFNSLEPKDRWWYLCVHTGGGAHYYEEGPTSVFPAPPLVFSLPSTGGHCQSRDVIFWDAVWALSPRQCWLGQIFKISFPETQSLFATLRAHTDPIAMYVYRPFMVPKVPSRSIFISIILSTGKKAEKRENHMHCNKNRNI